MITLSITPRDPIVARDARPAGTGNRLRSLDWIHPSVLAGSLRTMLGKAASPVHIPNPFDDDAYIRQLKDISVTGPFPRAENRLYFPAPRDLVIYEKNGQRHFKSLRPESLSEGEGCDLPSDACWPIAVTEDAKPAPAPAFWSEDRMAAWLAEDSVTNFPAPSEDDDGYLGGFEKEDRVHACIDPVRFVAEDGRLFSAEGLAISPDDLPLHKSRLKQTGIRLVARISGATDDLQQALSGLSAWHTLGGERRLAHFQSHEDGASWACPNAIARTLSQAKGVRMMLATPAIFAGGWLPGWLDPNSLEGAPPGCAVRLKLRGACLGRWQPLSGWSLEKGRRGPKAVRRLAPAGSVYFFEVLSNNPEELARQWLTCTSDDAQDRRDGFGASLWGIWNMPSQENTR